MGNVKGLVKKMGVVLMIGIFSVSLITGCGSKKEAASKEEGTSKEEVFLFKYSNQQNEKHPRTVSMLWFKDELEKRSDGRIKVEIYHSGVLGKEKELFQMTVTNALQGYRGAGYEQLTDKFNLWNVPFTFRSYDEVGYFGQSDFAKEIMKDGSKDGIYIPAVGFTGFRNLLNNKKKIERPEDLKGLKMRAPGQATIIKFYDQMGANPQEMPFSDVYMGLKTGVVDGVCTASSGHSTNKIYEVANHFTWINYMSGADPLMVSMKWYESLPDDLKKIFDEVSVEAMNYSNQLIAEQEDGFSEKLQEACDDTVKVSDDPELVKAWEEACEPLAQKYADEGLFTMDDFQQVRKVLDEYRNK